MIFTARNLLLLFIFLSSLIYLASPTVFITEDGVNDRSCILSSQGHCKTLDFALNEISNSTSLTGDVSIIVEYSHKISSLDISYSFHLNISVLGVDQPIVSCSNTEDYIHLTAFDNVPNVSISFDGIVFSGCNGLQNNITKEWIAGYAFINFYIVSLANVVITQSSDVFFAKNEKIGISRCKFHNNNYYYGGVYFSILNDTTYHKRNVSNNTISDSDFSENTGIATNVTPLGTVGGTIILENENFSFSLWILNCQFKHNHYNTVFGMEMSNIGLLTISAKLKTFHMTVRHCTFADTRGGVASNMIFVNTFGLRLNKFQMEIGSNTFTNNSFTAGGSLTFVNLYWSVIPSAIITYEYNNVSNNVGRALKVMCSNNTYPAVILLKESNFVQNHADGVIYIHSLQGYESFTVNVSNLYLFENTVTLAANGVVNIANAHMNILNSSFICNTGTALYLENTRLFVSGEIYFVENAGLNGGGMAMYGDSDILADEADVVFDSNIALYGGGAYIQLSANARNVDDFCNRFIDDNCDFKFQFLNNRASSSGNNVFFEQINLPVCVETYLEHCLNISDDDVFGFASCTVDIVGIYSNQQNASVLQVFPGQNIIINSTVIDAFQHESSCVATVFLQCDNEVISCKSESDGQLIQLEGPTLVTLGLSVYTSDIKLLAPNNVTNSTFNTPSLRFQCDYTEQYVLYLDIVQCPLGFTYNETSCACQCAFENHDGYLCSVPHGMACVAKGYWLGLVDDGEKGDVSVITRCRYLYCQPSTTPCPDTIGQDSSSYVLVGPTENDQCQANHGGITCTNCREGATFSFEGILCIDNKECQPWQPYLLLIMVIGFQFILAYLLQLFLNIQTMHGIGFLFGPLFFIATINTFPFAYYEEYYHLKTVISIYSSFLLLNMEVFGFIKWCFFSSFSALDNYSFHYLGPLIVAVVLIITILIARKCPKLQSKLCVHPLKAICLLLLQSFWSLSDTSIRILQVEQFPGVYHYRVALQPDLRYFKGNHIVLSIISIILGVMILYPLTLLLLFAPLLSKKISLHRFQPLLDQFQSSYRDAFRWYPGVYMVGWLIIVAARQETIVMQTMLTIMLTMFFILQPYSVKWLNIANSLLLLDLLVIDALLNEQNNPNYGYSETLWVKPIFVFLVYLMTILPLVYITLIIAGVIIVRFNLHHKLSKAWARLLFIFKRSGAGSSEEDVEQYPRSPQSSIHQSIKETAQHISRQLVEVAEDAVRPPPGEDDYREPLISMMQDEELEQQTYKSNSYGIN